jgi:outer membrane protein assembly factor BamB
VQTDLQTLGGQVLEVGADGRPLWGIDGLHEPIAAQVLPGDRVLIAEYAGKRVSERSFRGKTLWEKELPGNPVAAQRLSNGNTFVACRNRLLEIDRDGKEVADDRRPVRDVLTARKHRDGSVVLITHDGYCRRLDATGKEVSRFPVPGPHVMGLGIDLLPNRRVIVPRFEQDRVTEFDAAGNVLWEAAVPAPTSAARLPNGHTLVASTTTRLVVELDRQGRVAWQHQAEQALVQAARR